ncbi:uncharacterized protein LY89DRAFT_788882 [Mollisia scopiformis]|uniref:Gastric mucin-like protein n=1 Tax=Mollisia scopiformis TaxID=149040 RepID=A0A132B938_MOLSC|nr:uncharacterized protein LY89DRAFT_788882 [Mollisia scopiformis]KUJ08509.1 hypothetical protein LY89DRAFT_788882 [Mollisia scopiformis]
MMAVLELEPEQLGRFVALEGDSETIATQLRLLPPSQKILIVPALPDAFSQNSDKDSFNPSTFIRNVHTAFTERSEAARAFLRKSTSTQPRLVLQNGGSVSARATCISKIANLTEGDIGRAETIFNEIVKDGLAGLMKLDVGSEDDKAMLVAQESNEVQVQDGMEDPSVRAMKAADSLERETEALQPNSAHEGTPGLETTVDSHAMGASHSTLNGSVPLKSSDASEVPQKVVGIDKNGNNIVRTVLTVPSRSRRFTVEEKRTTFGTQFTISTPATASTIGPTKSEETEEDDEDLDFASPEEESMFSAPATPAVYKEAFLVDVQSSPPTKTVRKAQSIDMFYSRNSKLLHPSSGPMQLKHTASDYHLRRPAIPERRSDNYQTLPRTTFMKASQTTIRKSPTLSASAKSNSSSTEAVPPRVYVDRGEDAFQVSKESMEPFVPVFPVVEDLIIHLVDDNANQILESVISSYKDGTYPALPPTTSSPLPEEGEDQEAPISAVQSKKEDKALRPESCLTAETDDMGYERRHDYDPYNDSYPPDIKRQWPPMQNNARVSSLDSSVGPPTPTLTPPVVPEVNDIAQKFVDFTPTNPNNAINVQNSLRQLLILHLPAGENGYSQHYYPVTPEAERLWKPVFRNDQNTSIGNDGRNVDQIIALGCEDGVKKDFFFQMSGQVERLGSKRDGVNRSGRLDIRYLIANIMQHSSGFSTQSSVNPLSNPHILAALLVPQIEAYLAINTSTRLLVLQYPASHLPTVFALRKLLGSDLFKIAGILDSLASDPPPMSRPRTPNPLSNEAISQRAANHSRLNSLQRTRIDSTRADSITTLQRQTSSAGSVRSSLTKSLTSASFAKADYLLPSTATDSEITTFLSSIWKALMEKSVFYTPEPEPKPIIIERPPMPPPPTPTGSSRDIRRDRMERERERHRERDLDRDADRDSNYAPSSRTTVTASQSKISRLTGGSATGPSGPRSTYSPSVISTSTARPSTRHRERDRDTDYDPSIASTRHKYAASIASTKTTASEKERRRDKEWENFYIGDEDSEDDAYDRMIMGRAGQRIVPEPEVKVVTQKRDKRKALKWLGLA